MEESINIYKIYIFVYRIIFWNIFTKRNLLSSMSVSTVNCGSAHT